MVSQIEPQTLLTGHSTKYFHCPESKCERDMLKLVFWEIDIALTISYDEKNISVESIM